jgi:hypothetical protein
MEMFCHNKYSCEMSKPKYLPFERYSQGWSFQYVGQTPRSKSQEQIFLYLWKGLVTRNTRVKYQLIESPNIYHSIVIAKVKVFIWADDRICPLIFDSRSIKSKMHLWNTNVPIKANSKGSHYRQTPRSRWQGKILRSVMSQGTQAVFAKVLKTYRTFGLHSCKIYQTGHYFTGPNSNVVNNIFKK